MRDFRKAVRPSSSSRPALACSPSWLLPSPKGWLSNRLSENSVESMWVEKEVETAFEKEAQQNRFVLFPVRLDNTVMQTTQAWAADIRRTRHIGDFRNWKNHDEYQKSFYRLLRDLKAGG